MSKHNQEKKYGADGNEIIEKILKKRIKDENNQPFAMVIALNKNQLGWSICNREKGDKYNDKEAFRRAKSKATSQKVSNFDFWESVFDRKYEKLKGYKTIDQITSLNMVLVLDELAYMQERAIKYFKE